MTKLVLTRGLPASGKTTWALAWCAEDPANRVRVNRDELRHNLYGVWFGPPVDEPTVTVAQQAAVRALLRKGKSVVVDDTNLRRSYFKAWMELAAECGAEFDWHDLTDVPLQTCIDRDGARHIRGERYVGTAVIRSFHDRYLASRQPFLVPELGTSREVETYVPNEDNPDRTWIVDIDGTLALMTGRGPFDTSRYMEDRLNRPVARVVHALREAGYWIIVTSGRDEEFREVTERWLESAGVIYRDLVMRPRGDTRRDDVVKRELFWEHIAPRYAVYGVLDDRDRVVEMWRSLGLTCLQVAPGDF